MDRAPAALGDLLNHPHTRTFRKGPVMQIPSNEVRPALVPDPSGRAGGTATTPPAGAAPATAKAASAVHQDAVKALDPAQMRAQLEEAIRQLNKMLESAGRSLGFSMDEAAGRTVVKVTDRNTGELVRQIPGEAVLSVAHSIESLKGILYSKKA